MKEKQCNKRRNTEDERVDGPVERIIRTCDPPGACRLVAGALTLPLSGADRAMSELIRRVEPAGMPDSAAPAFSVIALAIVAIVAEG